MVSSSRWPRSPSSGRRTRLAIGAAVLVTLLPSIYLAAQLVQHEWFATRAQRYVTALEAADRNLVVLSRDIDARKRLIQLTMLGENVTPEQQRSLEARLPEFGLAGATLEIRAPTARRAAAAPVAELQRRSQLQLEEKTARLTALEAQLGQAQAEVADRTRLAEEIHAQWPTARSVQVLPRRRAAPPQRSG